MQPSPSQCCQFSRLDLLGHLIRVSSSNSSFQSRKVFCCLTCAVVRRHAVSRVARVRSMIQRSRSTDTNHTMSRPFDTLHGLTQFGADAVQGSVLGSWRQDLETDIATGISGLLHDERSRDEGRESGDSDSSFESCETPMPQRGGLRYWAPRLYAWLAPRVGNRARCAIALTFAVLEGSKERAWDFAGHEVNYLSIQVMACAVSLTIALCISFFMEGQWVASLV